MTREVWKIGHHENDVLSLGSSRTVIMQIYDLPRTIIYIYTIYMIMIIVIIVIIIMFAATTTICSIIMIIIPSLLLSSILIGKFLSTFCGTLDSTLYTKGTAVDVQLLSCEG